MHEVLDNRITDQKDWYLFNNWDFMTIKEDIVEGNDYYIITQSNWMKLKATFGGAPEIPFFTYNVEKRIERSDGEVLVEKEVLHDFNPIKIRVHQVNMQGDLIGENFTMLVSQHITVQRFNAYITTVRKDCNAKQKIFVIRPKIEGLCPIYEAPSK